MGNARINPFIELYFGYNKILSKLTKNFIGQRYDIMPISDFQKQLKENQLLAMQTCWKEILMRAHLAATTSLMRTKLWFDGCLNAYANSNFLSFASNLRGLLEGTADTCYALKPVPKTLAENFTAIINTITMEEIPEKVPVSKELEDRLIHFYFARRLPQKSTGPGSHRARTAREYISEIQGADAGSVFNLYSDLCQLSHPSMASLKHLVRNIDGQAFEIHGNDGFTHIERLCERNRDAFSQMTAGINISLLMLRTINEFPINSLHTPTEMFTWGEIIGWKNIESIISSCNN